MLFDNGATQTYHYTADGEKWRTVYMAGMLLKDTVDYCGGAIVENGVLKKLLTPVGYVDMSGSTHSEACLPQTAVYRITSTMPRSGTTRPSGTTMGHATMMQPLAVGMLLIRWRKRWVLGVLMVIATIIQ